MDNIHGPRAATRGPPAHRAVLALDSPAAGHDAPGQGPGYGHPPGCGPAPPGFSPPPGYGPDTGYGSGRGPPGAASARGTGAGPALAVGITAGRHPGRQRHHRPAWPCRAARLRRVPPRPGPTGQAAVLECDAQLRRLTGTAVPDAVEHRHGQPPRPPRAPRTTHAPRPRRRPGPPGGPGRPRSLPAAAAWPGFASARLLGGVDGQFTFRTKSGLPHARLRTRRDRDRDQRQHIVVQAADGTTWTWDLVSDTVVREHGAKTARARWPPGSRSGSAGR